MNKRMSHVETEFDLARNHPKMPDDVRRRVLKAIHDTKATDGIGATAPTSAQAGRSANRTKDSSSQGKLSRNRRRGPVVGLAGVAGVAIVAFFLVESVPSWNHNPLSTQATLGVPPSTGIATSVQLVTKSEDTKHYNVAYPQIHGMQNPAVQKHINLTLRTMAMKPAGLAAIQKQYGKKDPIASIFSEYTISYQRGNLIDFVLTSEVVPKFTADGGPTLVHSAIFNLSSGKQYAMSDLFKHNSGYLRELSSLVKKNDPQHLLGHGFPYPKVKETDTFVLTNHGIGIVFQQDEWTAHVDGTPEFDIPFGQLTSLINTKSQMWGAIKTEQATTDAKLLAHDVAYMKQHGYLFARDTTDVSSLGMYEAIQHSPASQAPIYGLVGIAAKSQTPTKVFFFKGKEFIGVASAPASSSIQGVYPGANGSISVNIMGSQFVNGRLQTYYVPYRFDGKKMVAGKKTSHP